MKRLLRRVRDKCPELLRRSWSPVINRKLELDTLTNIGGTPFTSDMYPWPICKIYSDSIEDQHRVPFVLQVNLDTIPEQLKVSLDLFDGGLIQAFHCIECSPTQLEGGGCYGFTDLYEFDEVRLIPREVLKTIRVNSLQYLSAKKLNGEDISSLPEAVGSYVNSVNYEDNNASESKFYREPVIGNSKYIITGWSENSARDIPINEELAENREALDKIGMSEEEVINLRYEDEDEDEDEEEDEDDDDMSLRLRLRKLRRINNKVLVTVPKNGIKLGGWLDWCEGPEYPRCPDCPLREAMNQVLLQVEHGDNCSDYDPGQYETHTVLFVLLCPKCKKPFLGGASKDKDF